MGKCPECEHCNDTKQKPNGKRWYVPSCKNHRCVDCDGTYTDRQKGSGYRCWQGGDILPVPCIYCQEPRAELETQLANSVPFGVVIGICEEGFEECPCKGMELPCDKQTCPLIPKEG
jgi:hypothetical protein